jgi:hypothetical protein
LSAAAWLATSSVSFALEVDGVTGLPTDVTSLLSIAGVWQPVDNQYLNANFDGTLARTPAGVFKLSPTSGDSILLAGWAYSGFNNNATSITPVNVCLLEQQADGTLKVATSKYISSPTTNGNQSPIIADFNGDGYDDILLLAHNESPFIPMPSTAFMSNGSGGFNKITLQDKVEAHDVELTKINGVLTVTTGTFTNTGGDSDPYYQFKNGSFVETLPTRLSGKDSFGNSNVSNQSMAIGEFGGTGKYQAVFGDFLYGPGVAYSPAPAGYPSPIYRIANYPFDGIDIGASPIQLLEGYFNSRSQYSNVSSNWGPGNTHTYRLKTDDFNHDGAPDLIGMASLWTQATQSFPAALQMLQNDGTGRFTDVSDMLTASVNTQLEESDYELQIKDYDGSGINSYASGSFHYDPANINTANYLTVNDGTGQLHYAISRQQMDGWTSKILAYLKKNPPSGYACYNSFVKFVAYQTPNKKTNYLVINLCSATTAINGNSHPWAAVLVNLPLQIDLRSMYTAPMKVSNRNGSHLIRTFAGDDIIYSGNSGGYAHIDGGLGYNTLVYSGPASNYTVVKNTDGSFKVTDNVGKDGIDTLVNIQRLIFADKTNVLVTPDTGWWWNQYDVAGRGYSLEVNNGRILLASYMYRDDGSPIWYIADEAFTNGSFSGTLFDVQGTQTLNATGPGKTSTGPTSIKVSGTFSSSTQGTITLTDSRFSGGSTTIPITRFPIDSVSVKSPTTAIAPQTGWWWNTNEPGVGYFIEQQSSQIFYANYLYGDDQRDLWFISLNSVIPSGTSGVAMTGSLLKVTGGQTLTSGAKTGAATTAGQITLQFTSPTSGAVTLPSGRVVQISRFTTF